MTYNPQIPGWGEKYLDNKITTAVNNSYEIAKNLNAKGAIYHQDEALGTAHAILCAKKALEGPVVVAFADTLFRADFTLDTEKDGIIWVQKVEDPKAYGVIKMNENNVITDFIEKPVFAFMTTDMCLLLRIVHLIIFKSLMKNVGTGFSVPKGSNFFGNIAETISRFFRNK